MLPTGERKKPQPDFVRWGQIGGLTRASRSDNKQHMQPALRAYMRKWEQLVDPEGVLPVEERQRRAAAARKAHLLRIGMKGNASQRRGRKLRKNNDAAPGSAASKEDANAAHPPSGG